MRVIAITILLFGVLEASRDRPKRQSNYQFPGPRSGGQAYQGQGDSSLYQAPRRQFQGQPVQQYSPPQAQNTQYNPRASSSYGGSSGGSSGGSQSRQPSGGGGGGGTQYRPDGYGEEQQEASTPDPLSVLLQDSKFSCSGKSDGYYSDNSVNCQAFHYCVGGAKHSWMCPSGTVFHQVHLNCVPSSQDICNNAEKFYFVNDYLHKALEQKGPNNTVLYAQRYYPEGYVLGDTLLPPGGQQGSGGYQQGQGSGYQQGQGSGYQGGQGSGYQSGGGGSSSSYGGSPQSQPAYRPPASQPAPYQPPASNYQPPASSYRPPSSSYQPARQPSISQPSSPAYRPSQQSVSARAPSQSYGAPANSQPFAGLPDLSNFGANIPGFQSQIGGGGSSRPGGAPGFSPQQLGLGLPPGGPAAGRPGYGGGGGGGGVRYDDEYYN